SRRRHTRLQGDWSSDVCSSDLYHLPPSVHCTWANDGFEVCTFAPRPTETGDPEALRVPFFHSNIDRDEVLFYHSGQFFSRAGIEIGRASCRDRVKVTICDVSCE